MLFRSAHDISLSAANSVNFGRIIFQIIYHVHSYLELVRQEVIQLGEKVYLNVPSGNFGNALRQFAGTFIFIHECARTELYIHHQ